MASILHVDAQVGMSIYSVIHSDKARNDALEAIAKPRLSEDAYKRLKKLGERIRSTTKIRDRMVHNIWALSNAHPESLILVDSRKQAAVLAGMVGVRTITARRAVSQDELNSYTAVFMDALESAQEYQEKDFIDAQEAIKLLCAELVAFDAQLQQAPPRPRTQKPPQA